MIRSTSAATTFVPAARVQSFGPTVFAEFTALAIEHDAVNLGQGFPNFPAPDFIKEAAATAITGDLNQYARAAGHPRLVNALAQSYSPLFGRELDPLREIVVTVGATEVDFDCGFRSERQVASDLLRGAEQLVAEGHVDGVRDYLINLAAGATG